jgi:hypothetical protein
MNSPALEDVDIKTPPPRLTISSTDLVVGHAAITSVLVDLHFLHWLSSFVEVVMKSSDYLEFVV